MEIFTTTDPGTLLLLFCLGIAVRSLWAIRREADFAKWVGAWPLALLVVIGFADAVQGSGERLILLLFLAFAFCVTLLLYKNILPKVGEYTILMLNLLFLYCFTKYYLFSYPDTTFFFVMSLIPFAMVLYISFVRTALSRNAKIFFYFWFVLLTSFFIAFYLFSKEISLLSYTGLHFSSPYEAFLTGFTAFMLMANFGFIYKFFFPGNKNDTTEEEERKWQEFISVLVSRHNNSQLHGYQALLIVVVVGGGLLLNYFFNLVADGILIPTFLFLSQLSFPTNVVDHKVKKGK